MEFMISVATFTFAMPREIARRKSSGGVPDPPCRTSGMFVASRSCQSLKIEARQFGVRAMSVADGNGQRVNTGSLHELGS